MTTYSTTTEAEDEERGRHIQNGSHEDQTRMKCGLEFTDINFILKKISDELDRPYKEWLTARNEVSSFCIIVVSILIQDLFFYIVHFPKDKNK